MFSLYQKMCVVLSRTTVLTKTKYFTMLHLLFIYSKKIMNTQATKPIEQMSLTARIFDCLDNSSSPEKIVALSEEFHNRTDQQDDKAFLKSMAILDFLAHQIREGNHDLISPKIIEETCTYILIHILPQDRLIPLKIEQHKKHKS